MGAKCKLIQRAAITLKKFWGVAHARGTPYAPSIISLNPRTCMHVNYGLHVLELATLN